MDTSQHMNQSIYRLRPQDLLAVCVLGLLCLGILMVQSASMRVPDPEPAIANHVAQQAPALWHISDYVRRHIGYVVLALFTFFVIGRFDYRRLAYEGRKGNSSKSSSSPDSKDL